LPRGATAGARTLVVRVREVDGAAIAEWAEVGADLPGGAEVASAALPRSAPTIACPGCTLDFANARGRPIQRLASLSFQTGGFCPWCDGRRRAERARRWTEELMPRVAVRQLVIAAPCPRLPWPRRGPLAPGGAAATAEAQGRAGRGRGAAAEGRHGKLEVDALERAVVAGVRRQRHGLPDVRQRHGGARRGAAQGPDGRRR